jgi:hypothetical protein
MSEKHLYIDFSHICHRNVFAQAHDIKAMGFGIFRHAVIKSVIYNIEKFEPNKVYICCDAPRNWRKKYYEPYKGHRAEAKSKFDIDWNAFHETIDEVIMGFRSNFPFYVLRLDWLEADDIVSYLTRKYTEANKIILSSDSDFVQLMRFPNTRIYCPLKNQFIECENPIFHLERKIVMGDKNSDNIPAIRPGLGIVKSEKLIESGDLDKMLNDTNPDKATQDLLKNYERNKKLIDLTKTPKALIDLLEKELEVTKPASSKGVYQYIVKHKMKDMFYKISQIDAVMRKLNPINSQEANPNNLVNLSPLSQ